jgi:hypothetical protein
MSRRKANVHCLQRAFEDDCRPVMRANVKTEHSEIGGVHMLLDSGSDITLVSRDFFRRITSAHPEDQRKEWTGKVITVANGTTTRVQKYLSLRVLIGSKWTSVVKAFALEDLPVAIVIGNDALSQWGAVLDWRTRTLRMGDVAASWKIEQGAKMEISRGINSR